MAVQVPMATRADSDRAISGPSAVSGTTATENSVQCAHRNTVP